MKNLNKIDNAFMQYGGTDSYHRYVSSMVITDGVKSVCDKYGLFWFLDQIAYSGLKDKDYPFQVWKINKRDKEDGCRVICEDGNYNKVLTKEIEFTDFKFNSVTLWKIGETIILPNEY